MKNKTIWSNDWKDYARKNEPEFMTRLGECRSKPHDVVILATLIWSVNRDEDAMECYDRAVEWITDWNNQFELFDKIAANENRYIVELLDNITDRRFN